MAKKPSWNVNPASTIKPMGYKSNPFYSLNQKNYGYPPTPPASLMSPSTMPYNFKELILPNNISKLANTIGIDPFELQFLISQIENVDNEILIPRLKSLFSEMKLIYNDEVQTNTEHLKKRKQEYDKWLADHQKAKSLSKTAGVNFRALKAQEALNDLYDRYTRGVHVWSKRQLKKDKELRFILTTYTLHFVKKGSFPFTKLFVEGLKPDLSSNPYLVDEIYNLITSTSYH